MCQSCRTRQRASVTSTSFSLGFRELTEVGQTSASSRIRLSAEVSRRRTHRLQLANILRCAGRCNRRVVSLRANRGGVPNLSAQVRSTLLRIAALRLRLSRSPPFASRWARPIYAVLHLAEAALRGSVTGRRQSEADPQANAILQLLGRRIGQR